MDHCSLTQEKIRVTKCAVLSPCAHAFDVTAFVLYCAKSKSPSGCVTCPNCRQPVKGVLNDRRGPYELVGERTVIFKHGKILFNLVLPLSSPQEDDDELIRNFLCIARGRIKFLGKKGTKGFTVIGNHVSAAPLTALDPGGAGGFMFGVRRHLRLLMRPWEVLTYIWGVIRLFFSTMLDPPPPPP